MVTITEFTEARIAEKLSAAHDEVRRVVGSPRRNGKTHALRQLREAEAMRRIVELHKSWPVLVQSPRSFEDVDPTDPTSFAVRISQQIAWATQQEYRAAFGDEPPTAPMVAALASIWSDHPDFDETWALDTPKGSLLGR